MPEECRRRKRITMAGEVIIDDQIKAKGLDFSAGGMYVFTKKSMEKGKNIKVTIPFKDTTLNLNAVVQHVEENAGMGIRFIDIDDTQKSLISDFLDYFDHKSFDKNKKKVLVGDSNDLSRRSDVNRLAIEGFAVIDATNGLEVLDILETERVDLVVIDLFLAKMDAVKLLCLMKQTPNLQNIPVIILTSSNKPEDVDRAAAAGAVEILPRITTSPIKLAERVKAILKI